MSPSDREPRGFTLRDFCEPGDEYVDFGSGERITIGSDDAHAS